MAGESPLSMMRPQRPRAGRRGAPARSAPRRRTRPAIIAAGALIVLAGGWCGLWYLAAGTASRTLAGWVQREAAAGRVYNCGRQDISGFPFHIEARCVQATAAINTTQPPLSVTAKDISFTAQVYQPTVLVGDVTGPLTVAQPGQSPSYIATWSLARMSVSGLPPDPNSVSIQLDQPHVDRLGGGTASTLAAADAADLQARIIAGAANNNPVIETVLHFVAATAPTVHPILAAPLRGNVDIILTGFKNLSPKPLSARFREMQASGGNIQIKSLRIERTDAVVVGTGTLTVNEHGRLDGLVRVAVSGLENVVPQLGIDQLIDKGISRLTGKPGQGLSALDQLMPGLSGVVRQTASSSLIDDVKKMGEPAQIDNKPATALPLRFSDGAVYLGILRIGEVPALF